LFFVVYFFVCFVLCCLISFAVCTSIHAKSVTGHLLNMYKCIYLQLVPYKCVNCSLKV
jgi:hypothetical protein